MSVEVIMVPVEFEVGDEISMSVGNRLVVKGRITEVVQRGLIYKIDVQEGGIQARVRKVT